MKKSLITLALLSVFALTACDDKTSQIQLELEKKVVQLEEHTKKAEENLAVKERELAQAKSALEAVKAQAEQCDLQALPAIQAKTINIIDKKEPLKFEKDPDDKYANEQGEITFFVSAVKTGIQWLDNLLFKHLVLGYEGKTNEADVADIQGKPIELTELKALFEQRYQENIEQAKKDKANYENTAEMYYIGQRNNIAAFSLYYFSYQGGAHGIFNTRYLNIDLQKKAVIQLNDLVRPQNQAKLQDLLWQSYTSERLDETGKFEEDYITKKAFYVSDNFYFTPTDIHFVYPVYALAPYVEGEVEIVVGFNALKDLLNKDYLLNE